jgi:integrase
VLILAVTGLRWGEAIALTVADVEFLKRRITVHRNAVQVGQEFEVGQTKDK